jgi:hypothetical protein
MRCMVNRIALEQVFVQVWFSTLIASYSSVAASGVL